MVEDTLLWGLFRLGNKRNWFNYMKTKHSITHTQ